MSAAPLTRAGLLHKALGEMLQRSFCLALFPLPIPAAEHLQQLSLMQAEGSLGDYIPATTLPTGNTANLGASMDVFYLLQRRGIGNLTGLFFVLNPHAELIATPRSFKGQMIHT